MYSHRFTYRLIAALPLLFALAIPVDARGVQHGASALHYNNPVFSRPFPDPMVLRLGGHDYWAYGTTLGWITGYFPILHSTDLVHWRAAGQAFNSFPVWAHSDFWAPDVIKHGKTYYLYYTGDNGTTHCIGVATASSPKGPFHHRSIVGCGDKEGFGWIDPDLYIAPNGKAYLYVSVDGPPHAIAAVPMAPDLLHKSGESTILFGVTQPWEDGASIATVEGPFMLRRGDTYYLFYSGNDTFGQYAMGYATGSSPLGPFTKYTGNPVLRGTHKVKAPGGGSIVQGPDNKLWMVYHALPPNGDSAGDHRTLRIDPLVWQGTTVTIPVHPR